jgi:hypothetical protein
MTSLVIRTYLRYLVVVTVLAAIVFAPLLYLAFKLRVPNDLAHAKGVVRTAWLLVGFSLAPLLVLVGGVTPAVRSLADGRPLSQLGALWAGVGGLVRAALPCAVVVLAVIIGSLALALPGLAALALLALAGATADTDGDLAARLHAAVAAARPRIVLVIVVLVVTAALFVGATYVLHRGLPIPLPKPPKPEHFIQFPLMARYSITGIALAAPLPAIALAAIAARARPSP